jgi:rubrerythrin
VLTLRLYPSPIPAEHAAAHLRAHAIDARTSSRLDASGWGGAMGHGQFELILINAADRDRAEQLLATLPAAEPVSEADLIAQAVTDLSRLDPKFLPTCPACRVLLRADHRITRCPSCGHALDIEALILEQHGPEALADCYPEEHESVPPDLLHAAAICCPACQYSLETLPAEGLCPECGTPYSKPHLIRRRPGPL